jgi:hypothetical protein
VQFAPTETGDRQASLNVMGNFDNLPNLSVALSGQGAVTSGVTITQAPTAFARVGNALALDPTLANSKLALDVKWAVTGAYSGAQLQVSTNGGGFVDVSSQPAPGATSAIVSLPMGTGTTTYQFQVHACDATGNCGAWAKGPRFTVSPTDDNTGFSYNGSCSGQNWRLQQLGASVEHHGSFRRVAEGHLVHDAGW